MESLADSKTFAAWDFKIGTAWEILDPQWCALHPNGTSAVICKGDLPGPEARPIWVTSDFPGSISFGLESTVSFLEYLCSQSVLAIAF